MDNIKKKAYDQVQLVRNAERDNELLQKIRSVVTVLRVSLSNFAFIPSFFCRFHSSHICFFVSFVLFLFLVVYSW